jgi:hypothetical protein
MWIRIRNPAWVVRYLGVDGMWVRLEGRLVPARLHAAPVDGVEPGVDLHLADPVAARAAPQPAAHRLLQQALAQRPDQQKPIKVTA